MESIIYNISNCYFPVTVYLKAGAIPGGAIIATNTHNFAGEYSFDNVLEGQYTIHVVDSWGCSKMINTPPIEGDCEIDGTIECGLTTTTLEVTTTLSPTTTVESTTTIDATTTLVESCVEYGLLYNWYAFVDARQISSSDDWILPSDNEFEILLDYIDTYDTELSLYPLAGDKLREIGVVYWLPPNTGATNEYSFNARGAGGRDAFDGTFYDLLGTVDYRVNTSNGFSSHRVEISSGVPEVVMNTGWNYRFGGSIRLVKSSTLLSNGEYGEYIGNDGRSYRTICIGTQEWLADNLMETQFRNGDIIPWYGANPANYFTNVEWAALETAGMCTYDNDVSYVGCDFQFPSVTTTTEPTTTVEPTTTAEATTTSAATTTTEPTTTGLALVDVNYGYLYNWYAASDARNLSNEGWRVPTNADHTALMSYLSSQGYLGLEGKVLKEVGDTYWYTGPALATNEYGFNWRGSGYRNNFNGIFENIGNNGRLWASDAFDATNGRMFQASKTVDYAQIVYDNKKRGYSLRLIKESTSLTHGQTGTYVGNDGKIYQTICIGTQEWLAYSLVETQYRNGDPVLEVTDGITWGGLTTGARCAYDNDESNAINP